MEVDETNAKEATTTAVQEKQQQAESQSTEQTTISQLEIVGSEPQQASKPDEQSEKAKSPDKQQNTTTSELMDVHQAHKVNETPTITNGTTEVNQNKHSEIEPSKTVAAEEAIERPPIRDASINESKQLDEEKMEEDEKEKETITTTSQSEEIRAELMLPKPSGGADESSNVSSSENMETAPESEVDQSDTSIVVPATTSATTVESEATKAETHQETPVVVVESVKNLFANVRYHILNSRNAEVESLLDANGAHKEPYLGSFVTHVICDAPDDNSDFSEAKEVFELPIVNVSNVLLKFRV